MSVAKIEISVVAVYRWWFWPLAHVLSALSVVTGVKLSQRLIEALVERGVSFEVGK